MSFGRQELFYKGGISLRECQDLCWAHRPGLGSLRAAEVFGRRSDKGGCIFSTLGMRFMSSQGQSGPPAPRAHLPQPTSICFPGSALPIGVYVWGRRLLSVLVEECWGALSLGDLEQWDREVAQLCLVLWVMVGLRGLSLKRRYSGQEIRSLLSFICSSCCHKTGWLKQQILISHRCGG